MVIPAAVREAIASHARAELPNESCGLLLLEGDVAVEYVPGRNASPSPYYFELELDPVAWADLGDRDVEQAVVHSHVSSPRARRARTSSGSASGATCRTSSTRCAWTSSQRGASARDGIESLPVA